MIKKIKKLLKKQKAKILMILIKVNKVYIIMNSKKLINKEEIEKFHKIRIELGDLIVYKVYNR